MLGGALCLPSSTKSTTCVTELKHELETIREELAQAREWEQYLSLAGRSDETALIEAARKRAALLRKERDLLQAALRERRRDGTPQPLGASR